MQNSQSWAEALNINPENLSAWSSEAPSEMPLLVWCLREGKISLETYLDWAVEAYGLPHLNAMFFSEAFYPATLTQFRGRAEWTPWFFPINAWDDVITVACVEPPTDQIEGSVSYVLCDPTVMAEMFARFQDDAPAEAVGEAPVGMSGAPAPKFILNLDGLGEPSVAAVAAVEEEEEIFEPSLVLQATQVTALRSALAPKPAPVVTEDSSPDLDKAFDKAFEELKRDYQTALAMKCSEGEAVPFRWHSELSEIELDRAHVDLTVPSLFRIVARTLQPYHGYTVSSQVHEDFFASLNLIVVPSCVTAVPIMVSGELWGILVAFGAESAHGQGSLNHAREIADRLGHAFNNELSAFEAA